MNVLVANVLEKYETVYYKIIQLCSYIIGIQKKIQA